MSKLYGKPPISNNLLKKRISTIIQNAGYDDDIAVTINNLYDYMMGKKLFGGCHALSSVLYVALSELGVPATLHIGECDAPNTKPFDHSWLSVENSIIDLAIYMPLTQEINQHGGPNIFDTDVVTMQPSMVTYGINSGHPLSPETTQVTNWSFNEYMDKYPMERPNGLWTVVCKIIPAETPPDIAYLREKYSDTQRIFTTHT